jgi:serine/threonine-protein kinase
MPPAAGQTLGNLELTRPIKGGAMGSVWVAHHETLRTDVAVKFVERELMDNDPSAVERFKHEASASARIKSPHVVQVFDHDFTDDGAPYIVMELLEGETLEERLRRSPLSLAEATIMVTHVSKALGRAHRVGVVHRDIKPANIFMCTHDEEVYFKVFDFGIAKQQELPELDGLTNPGLIIGTPEFMSPELFSNRKNVDQYADLWALAVVAFYALTGELPFAAETLGELCTNLLVKDVPKITSLRPELPETLDAWFEKALAKEAGDRFADARELGKSFLSAVIGDDNSLVPGPSTRVSLPDLKVASLVGLSITESAKPPPSSAPPDGMGNLAPPRVPSESLEDDDMILVDTSKRRRQLLIGGAAVLLVLGGAVALAWQGSTSTDVASAPETASSEQLEEPMPSPAGAESEPVEAPSTAPAEASAPPSVSASAPAPAASPTVKAPWPTASGRWPPPTPKPGPKPKGKNWGF